MKSRGSGKVSQRVLNEIARATEELNSTPWWKPLKRQDAARRYRWALYAGACEELGLKSHGLAARRSRYSGSET